MKNIIFNKLMKLAADSNTKNGVTSRTKLEKLLLPIVIKFIVLAYKLLRSGRRSIYGKLNRITRLKKGETQKVQVTRAGKKFVEATIYKLDIPYASELGIIQYVIALPETDRKSSRFNNGEFMIEVDIFGNILDTQVSGQDYYFI